MPRWVDVTFDCVPLRSIGRLDVPIDASPKYRERCERIKRALSKHGSHNAYYLANASCVYHLVNHDDLGTIEFRFEGTALTDAADQKTVGCDLEVTLVRETCDWLTEAIVAWFKTCVERAAAVEFDRYIAAGDLDRTIERIEMIQTQTDQQGGYVGMYL